MLRYGAMLRFTQGILMTCLLSGRPLTTLQFHCSVSESGYIDKFL
jgi:hypothetical protein